MKRSRGLTFVTLLLMLVRCSFGHAPAQLLIVTNRALFRNVGYVRVLSFIYLRVGYVNCKKECEMRFSPPDTSWTTDRNCIGSLSWLLLHKTRSMARTDEPLIRAQIICHENKWQNFGKVRSKIPCSLSILNICSHISLTNSVGKRDEDAEEQSVLQPALVRPIALTLPQNHDSVVGRESQGHKGGLE